MKFAMELLTPKADFFAELLMEMGNPLGYDFDAVHVKKGISCQQGMHSLKLYSL
jgi:hypothetical protein